MSNEDHNKYDVLAPAQVFDYFDEKLEGDRQIKENRYNAGCFYCLVSGAVISFVIGSQYAVWIGVTTAATLMFLYGLVHILISR